MMTGIPIIMQAFDIQKFFDKENLRDAMNALYRAGVKGKNYRLFYLLNKNSKIKVRTGVGISNEKSIGESIAQGSIGGALVSAQNLDVDIGDYFEDCTSEMCYGSVRLQPVIYQDDLLRMSSSVEGAQEGNYRVEAAMKSKQLTIHPDKSVYLLAGKKHLMEKIKTEIEKNPLTYSDFVIKNKTQEKWLGEQLKEGGNLDSVMATIKERKGRVTASIFEIKAILEDIRMEAVGGMRGGLQLWEMAVVPMLLNNADMWTDLSNEAIIELEKLQNLFLTVLFAVPRSTPKPILNWDTITLEMNQRIKLRKLKLALHLKSLSNDSLAKQIFNEQIQNEWPGLTKEAKEICREWLIKDVTKKWHSEPKSTEWKKTLKSAAQTQNEKGLRLKMKKMTKMEEYVESEEPYEFKEYLKSMNMHDARLFFCLRSKMFPCKENFKHAPENEASKWLCNACMLVDSQSHILTCSAYKELREGKSLSSDHDVVNYYRKVLQIRTKLNIDQ